MHTSVHHTVLRLQGMGAALDQFESRLKELHTASTALRKEINDLLRWFKNSAPPSIEETEEKEKNRLRELVRQTVKEMRNDVREIVTPDGESAVENREIPF